MYFIGTLKTEQECQNFTLQKLIFSNTCNCILNHIETQYHTNVLTREQLELKYQVNNTPPPPDLISPDRDPLKD